LPASQKFQRVPATEAINRKAVERTYHQLLAGYSTAYGLVASIRSFPVLNAGFNSTPLGRANALSKLFFASEARLDSDQHW
jgi:hypothetical protein